MEVSFKVLACACAAAWFSGAAPMGAQAAANLETDSSVAGVSVAFNNYYAGSLNPEEELARAFSSGDSLEQVVKSGKEETPVVKSTAASTDFDNVAISQVSNYVNVRSAPDTGSAIVGKIYNNCAATIQNTVDGEGGKWYQIQSGSVNGYIKAQYFITGETAKKKAREVGNTYAKVTSSTTLRLREQPSLESSTLDFLSKDAEYQVLGEEGDFYKVSVDTDLVGYVFKDYVSTRVSFEQAVSTAEEEEKAREEAQRKKEAQEALDKLEEAKKEAQSQEGKTETAKARETEKTSETGKAKETEKETTKATSKSAETSFSGTVEVNPDGSGKETTKASETTKEKETTKASETVKSPETTKAKETSKAPETTKAKETTKASSGPGGGSGEVATATRTAVVAYAKQFLGNPYLYGGTSLTEGADCSGFTQAVFAHFGITTGRSSRDQAARGKEIEVSQAQPGDLLFYASGSYINHVAIYIGGGQVIHSSNPTTGICLAPANYRTPCKAVTFFD